MIHSGTTDSDLLFHLKYGHIVNQQAPYFDANHYEQIFTELAQRNPESRTSVLQGYGFDALNQTYEKLRGDNVLPYYHALSARAAILNAIAITPEIAEWADQLHGQGQDIVYLHRSHPLTEPKYKGLHRHTFVFAHTNEGTIYEAHNSEIHPLSEIRIEDRYDHHNIQIIHALSVMAGERREEVLERNPNSPVFSDIPGFLERVATGLSVRCESPFYAFDASHPMQTFRGSLQERVRGTSHVKRAEL